MTEFSSEQELQSISGDNRVEVGSALDPANFQTVLLIMLNRLYDVNMALLTTVDPQQAARLYDMHEAGAYLAPPPALALEKEENDEGR